MMKFISLIVLVLVSVTWPVFAAESEKQETGKKEEEPIIKGWHALALKPFTFESAYERSGDTLKDMLNGKLSNKRTTADNYRFTLKYEITVFDLVDAYEHFSTELRPSEKDLKEIPNAINKESLSMFLDGFKFSASGSWSNTAANIGESTGTSIQTKDQFTGKVGVSYKVCF